MRSVWSHLADIINVYFDLEELGFDLSLEQLGQLKGERIGGFADVESCGISCESLKVIDMGYFYLNFLKYLYKHFVI